MELTFYGRRRERRKGLKNCLSLGTVSEDSVRGDLKKEAAVGRAFLVERPAKASLWLGMEGPQVDA